MKLHPEKLKQAAEEAGIDLASLGASIERPGLRGQAAVSAVRNWAAGRDHPRCKRQDIVALAGALGRDPRSIGRFTSEVRNHRGSPTKARLVADLVRGKPVDEALNLLTFSTKRAATNMKKALAAAIADAEQADADVTRLFVAESRVDEGAHIKRFQPKDRGRAHPILKRTSHITVAVEERS